jgi:hypothetical protein
MHTHADIHFDSGTWCMVHYLRPREKLAATRTHTHTLMYDRCEHKLCMAVAIVSPRSLSLFDYLHTGIV